jgi:hypothetical protein
VSQQRWRRLQGRKAFIRAAEQIFEKVRDPSTGAYYYFDRYVSADVDRSRWWAWCWVGHGLCHWPDHVAAIVTLVCALPQPHGREHVDEAEGAGQQRPA